MINLYSCNEGIHSSPLIDMDSGKTKLASNSLSDHTIRLGSEPDKAEAREDYFEELSKQIDVQVVGTLREQLPKMDKRLPEQWCQYVMLEHFIPQQRAM